MERENIKRVLIWPVTIRLSHGILIVSLIGLLISGWLLKNVSILFVTAYEYHFTFAVVLLIALMIRLYGFIVNGEGVTNWKSLLPQRRSFAAVVTTLRCYFSFGRFPLPNWHAHNPLWAPLYLIMYIILVLQALSGVLLYTGYHTLVIDLHYYHNLFTTFIVSLVALHILTAIVHDLKSGNSDISAIIHGYRIFRLAKLDIPATTQFVSFKKSHVDKDDV